MADSETSPNNNRADVTIPPLPTPPGRRHKPAKTHLSDYESNNDDDDNNSQKSRTSRCCFACGTRAFMCTFVFLLLVVVMAVAFISFLYASLPHVYVRQIGFSKLDLGGNNTATGKAKLDADVDLVMEFKNRNHGGKLRYGTWRVRVAWQEIKLGKAEVGGFSQGRNNSTLVKVRTKVAGQVVYTQDVDQMVSDMKDEEAVFNVALRGHVSIRFGAVKINGLAVSVKCAPKKGLLDVAKEHKCIVRVFPV